ncbi:hypothetical protein [Alsobacter sp. R-9]
MRSVLDAMIPGHANRWPAAADVLDAGRMAQAVADALGPQGAAVIATAANGASALATLSRTAPDSARRLCEIVYRAYYTTPAVQAVIRELAEAGPRDASPDFDETLLAAVRGRQGGPWRMR